MAETENLPDPRDELIRKLGQQVATLEIECAALRLAAEHIVAPLRAVGEETGWVDSDETDRVYPWYELEPLAVALGANAGKALVEQVKEAEARADAMVEVYRQTLRERGPINDIEVNIFVNEFLERASRLMRVKQG